MYIWPSPAFENISHPFVLFSGLRVPEPPSVHAAPEEWQVSAAAPDVARESVRSAGLPLRLGVRTTQTLLLQRLHLRLPRVRPAATRSAVAPGSSKELQKWRGCMGACVLHISPHLETLFFSLQFLSISLAYPHKSVSPSIQHPLTHFNSAYPFFLHSAGLAGAA